MAEGSFYKIGCPHCGVHVEFPRELHGEVSTCPACGCTVVLRVPGLVDPVAKPAARDRKPGLARPLASRRDSVCTRCGFVGSPERETRGSFGVELALWLLFCAPGFIYTLWRVTSRYDVCPSCRSAAIIPATSPQGLKLVQLK